MTQINVSCYTVKVYQELGAWTSEIVQDYQGPGIEHLIGYYRHQDDIVVTLQAMTRVYELLTKYYKPIYG